jgi:hypothetical protein
MATARIGDNVGLDKQEHIGLSTDTEAFLAANTGLADGSVYMEVNGDKKVYIILKGTWYDIT